MKKNTKSRKIHYYRHGPMYEINYLELRKIRKSFINQEIKINIKTNLKKIMKDDYPLKEKLFFIIEEQNIKKYLISHFLSNRDIPNFSFKLDYNSLIYKRKIKNRITHIGYISFYKVY